MIGKGLKNIVAAVTIGHTNRAKLFSEVETKCACLSKTTAYSKDELINKCLKVAKSTTMNISESFDYVKNQIRKGDNIMKTSEKLQLEFDKLELRKKELEFKIVELKNRILAEEIIEAEPTAARQWLDSQKGYKYCSHPQKCLLDTWLHAIWEAGQKHQAEIERERYEPLMEACKRLVAMGKKKATFYYSIEKALKNLESGTEPDRTEELMEKLSDGRWNKTSAETKAICFIKSATEYSNHTLLEVLTEDTKIIELIKDNFSFIMTLTPIKD